MSIDYLERSRHLGKPIMFFLIEGAGDNFEETPIGPFGFNDGETRMQLPWIERLVNGAVEPVPFIEWPIKTGDISSDGTLDKSDITVTMALGGPLDSVFLAYPPSQVINMTVFRGHVDDELIPSNFPAIWVGRILTSAREVNELSFNCQPVSSSVKRPGLRRNYQIGCPHALYGPDCRAVRANATIVRSTASVNRNVVTLASDVGLNANLYIGGLIEWKNANNGWKEIRTITAISTNGLNVTVRGVMRGLGPNQEVNLVRGCNHLMSGCNTHENILNYGGQPFIPLENPLSTKNQFY